MSVEDSYLQVIMWKLQNHWFANTYSIYTNISSTSGAMYPRYQLIELEVVNTIIWSIWITTL